MKNLLPLLLVILAFFVFSTAAAADSSYTVKKNDCLWKIASKAKVSTNALYRLNRKVIGADPDLLQIGQKLKLPLVSASAKTKRLETSANYMPFQLASAMPGLEMSMSYMPALPVSTKDELESSTIISNNDWKADFAKIHDQDIQSLSRFSSAIFADNPIAISNYASSPVRMTEQAISQNGEQKSDRKAMKKAMACSIIPMLTLTLYPLRGRIRRWRKKPDEPKEVGRSDSDKIYIGSFSYNGTILFYFLGGSVNTLIAPLRGIAHNAFAVLGVETIHKVSFKLPDNIEVLHEKLNVSEGFYPLSFSQKRIFKKHIRRCCNAA